MIVASQSSSYRSVFKATAVLGVVQVSNIVIGIARNKVAALLLGPAGIGIIGLLTSATSTVSGFTNCGLSTSVIKNLSTAYEKNDRDKLGNVLYVFRLLLYYTGILGIVLTICLCRVLSNWLFGNTLYATSIAILSVSLLMTQLTEGNIAILKSCRQINYYAKANVLGNLASLVITIPLYYLFKVDAIVPVLIVTNVCMLIFSFLYRRRLKLSYTRPSKAEVEFIAKDVTKAGIAIAFSNVFPIVSALVIRSSISTDGGLDDVGYFSAGFAILNGYVGMIFSAMSSDYIPRLSGIVDDNRACKNAINNQLQLSILILLPLLSLLILFSNFIVHILYSADFYPMVGMVIWGALGMLMKTMNWCSGILLIPKRDNKAYLAFSILSAVVYLVLSVWLYKLWGITGLGVAFMLSQGFDIIPAYIFIYRKYKIAIKPDVMTLFVMCSVVLLALIGIVNLVNNAVISYSLQVVIAICTIVYSIIKLDKLMDLRSYIKSKFNS